ncbi:BMP family ABC transporter substrate-binding protein, partial [Bacillus pumilus]|uniref:BMP family ABC transporter substrate-binding protein n=1 Tax=Bacillus pumilus TaxID=1408 RepID=UPI003C24A42B
VKKVDKAVQDLTTKAKEGQFPGGEVITSGLKEGALDISPSQDNLNKDVLKKVEKWKQKIIKGEIKIPATRDELKDC